MALIGDTPFGGALRFVEIWEGGWSDHPDDPGGLTKWGVTLKALIAHGLDFNADGRVNHADLAAMTKAEAAVFYRRYYWEACKCDDLPNPIAFMVFDCAVNQGPARARRLLQQTLGVKADGVIGPVTLAAAWRRDRTSDATMALLRGFAVRRALHYTGLAHFATFGRGWLNRLFACHAVAVAAADRQSRPIFAMDHLA